MRWIASKDVDVVTGSVAKTFSGQSNPYESLLIMQRLRFFYDFSNYGSYDQLTDDSITQWHPAFLELGTALDESVKGFR